MEKYDRNDIPYNERMAASYVRGVALSLLDWVRGRFAITGPYGEEDVDLPTRFVAQVLKSLVKYKAAAMRLKRKGDPQCDTGSVRKQISNVVKCDKLIERFWENPQFVGEDHSFVLLHKKRYSMKLKQRPTRKPLDPSEELFYLQVHILTPDLKVNCCSEE